MRKMEENVRDLVCGMELNKNSASSILEYYDKVYYFCSLVCNEKFGREPEKYATHEERKWQ
jgi:YHS domain-containing protein